MQDVLKAVSLTIRASLLVGRAAPWRLQVGGVETVGETTFDEPIFIYSAKSSGNANKVLS
jgi:hypothetical protein